jgi:archaellum component FlaD/FlaE
MLLKWCEYLVSEAGEEGALRALMYYETIGWISTNVFEQVTEYVSSVSADETGDTGVEGVISERLEDTPFELHAGSLYYIGGLAGHNVEEQALEVFGAHDRVAKRFGSEPR